MIDETNGINEIKETDGVAEAEQTVPTAEASGTQFPDIKPRRRRSSLKRQRVAVLVTLGVVVVLAVAFALVWRFTSRIVVEYPNGDNVVDTDGTKYYTVQRDGVWVMINEDGDVCDKTSEGLYKTKDGTLVMVDTESGEATVVATVLLNGSESTMLDANDGSYDILLYPLLEREDIQSIHVRNVERDEETGEVVKTNDFTFERQSDDAFVLKDHPTTPIDGTMFATLIVVTGYTRTIARLDLSDENPDAEGFRQNGYAEYGLPEDPADAENYFVLTARDGTVHKVIIGDIILDDTGYYARYADRDEVYVLSQMEESDYNTTLSATLLGTVEDYVTPTITTTMGETNYFDVTDFTLYKANGDTMTPDLSFFEKLVQFSYEPIEARKDTYYAHIPYFGEGRFEGFAISENMADNCLQNILDMIPAETVKLYDDDGETEDNLKAFIGQYGLGYAIEFIFNAERAGADQDYEPTQTIPHQIWISPMHKTKDGTEVYYMFNEMFDMVVMTERKYLEFLEWNDFQWIEDGIFEANIIYLEQIEINIKNGTQFDAGDATAGLSGVTNASFDVSFVDKEGNAASGTQEDAEIRVFHDYIKDGVSSGSNNPLSDTYKFRMFYQSLYWSQLYDQGHPEDVEPLKSTEPDLEITMVFDVGDGEKLTRTYRFYYYTAGARGCYVTVNGNGYFYMQQSRAEKIVSDLGRLLHPTAEINPTAKT